MKAYRITTDVTRNYDQPFDVSFGDTKRDAIKTWMDANIERYEQSGYKGDKWVKQQGYENYQHMLGDMERSPRIRELNGHVYGVSKMAKAMGLI